MWRGPSHPVTSITGGHRCSRCTRAHTRAHSYTATGRVALEEQGSKYKCKHGPDILALENENAIYAREAAAPLFPGDKLFASHKGGLEVFTGGSEAEKKCGETDEKHRNQQSAKANTERRIKKKRKTQLSENSNQ